MSIPTEEDVLCVMYSDLKARLGRDFNYTLFNGIMIEFDHLRERLVCYLEPETFTNGKGELLNPLPEVFTAKSKMITMLLDVEGILFRFNEVGSLMSLCSTVL